jgi:hypothetical protein
MEPLAAEVWVTDPAYSHVLLVRHRVRGWVPPVMASICLSHRLVAFVRLCHLWSVGSR